MDQVKGAQTLKLKIQEIEAKIQRYGRGSRTGRALIRVLERLKKKAGENQ